MDLQGSLLALGLMIVVAKLLEGIFKRFGLNSIIAYAITGVFLGPVTGLIDPGIEIEIVLSIGIFIFFFLIGLEELDIRGFLSAIRGRLFIAAVLCVTISLLVSLAVTSDFLFDLGLDLNFTESLALAGVLSLSSLGVVAKVLIDEGRLREAVGVQIFTAVVIAELLALFVVGFAISEHFYAGEDGGHGPNPLSVAILIGQILGFTVATWFVSTRILPKVIVLLHRFLQVPQLSFGLLLGGLFLVVVAAEEVGLHGSLGALLFGAALSMLPYQVRRDIMPGLRSTAEGLFVPLFFASAGLHLTLDFLTLPPQTIAALIFVPLAGKFAAAFISAYMTRLESPFAMATGLMAKGVAEIALLILLLHTGAISEGIFSLMLLIMFGYILLTPMGMIYALRKLRHANVASSDQPVPPSLVRFALDGVRVRDVLDTSRSHPEQSLTVRAFTDNWLVPEQHDYVIEDNGRFAGIVSVGMLRYLPHSDWDHTTLGRVTRRIETSHAYSDEFVEDVLQRMTENSTTVLPVIDSETREFIGSISSHEVVEMIVLTAQGHEI
ncbi:MAG: cation:proton antiporter [Chloroflexi bacterium]|nr:cation:proton antiporter [Chloroflexota bacterium]